MAKKNRKQKNISFRCKRAVNKKSKISQRKKFWVFLCIPAIAIIVMLVCNFCFNWGENSSTIIAFDMISAITALLGVVGAVITLQRDKDLDEAQFTVDLNMNFIKQQDFYLVYNFWDKYRTEQEFLSMSAADKKTLPKIISLTYKYFDFFEPLFILVTQGLIKIEVIANIFEYRFCVVANNWGCQRYVLNPKDEVDSITKEPIERQYLKHNNYDNIVKLYCLLKEYKLSLENEDASVRAQMPLHNNDLWEYACSIGALRQDDLIGIIKRKNLKYFH